MNDKPKIAEAAGHATSKGKVRIVGAVGHATNKGKLRSAPRQPDEHDPWVEMIVGEIESWTDGDEIVASFINDGDGRFDFMGFKVTDTGRAKLEAKLCEILNQVEEV